MPDMTRRYFLEVENKFTDEMISTQAMDTCKRVACKDGIYRYLYEVNKQVFDYVWNSRTSQPEIKTKRFWQIGVGEIKPYYRDKKSARQRTAIGNKKPRHGVPTPRTR